MPIRRDIPQSRYGRRNLDPALPLFVLRRIAAGKDADGQPIVLVPGEMFDPSGIDGRRLMFLHRGRFIGHEPSRAMRQGSSVQPSDPLPVAETPRVPVAPPPAVSLPVEPPAIVEAPPTVAPAPVELAPPAVVIEQPAGPTKSTPRTFVPSRFSPPPGKRRGA